MRLTVKSSDGLKLKAGQSERIAFDDDIPGFGLRIREGGSRSWIFQYRIGKKQRRMVLGTANDAQLNLADMRKTASKLQGRVALGQDPAMDKETARREVENTFVVFAEQFLEARKPSWRVGTYREARRHFMLHAQSLHSFPIAAISQFNIAKLLDDIVKQSGGVTANRVRVSLSSLFSWIIKRGIRLPEGNVAAFTEKPCEEKSRDRVLTDAELTTVWKACLDDHYGAIIKLLMLTGSTQLLMLAAPPDAIKPPRARGAQDAVELPLFPYMAVKATTAPATNGKLESAKSSISQPVVAPPPASPACWRRCCCAGAPFRRQRSSSCVPRCLSAAAP